MEEELFKFFILQQIYLSSRIFCVVVPYEKFLSLTEEINRLTFFCTAEEDKKTFLLREIL